jgi:phosphotriesterase-related protein
MKRTDGDGVLRQRAANTSRTARSSSYSRRDLMCLLGAGAGLGAVAPLGRGIALVTGPLTPDADGAQSAQVARGAVIRTVLKDMDPAVITGKTLVHEHLGAGRHQEGQPRRPSDALDTMLIEMKDIQAKGVSCIVGASTGMPPPGSMEFLQNVSAKSGIHLIAACGYPRTLEEKNEEAIADDLVGLAAAGRWGAFCEIVMGADQADLTPVEKKVYRAVGRASVRTGLPILTHTAYSTGPNVPMDMGLKVLDLFESVGVKPEKVAIGHICCLDDPRAEVAQRIAKRGALVSFDRLSRQQQWIPDEKKAAMIKAFLDAGYVDHLLMSSDYNGAVANGEVENRPGPFWAAQGGPGWARSIVWFEPILMRAGVSEATIRRARIDNPRRWLAFVPAVA